MFYLTFLSFYFYICRSHTGSQMKPDVRTLDVTDHALFKEFRNGFSLLVAMIYTSLEEDRFAEVFGIDQVLL